MGFTTQWAFPAHVTPSPSAKFSYRDNGSDTEVVNLLEKIIPQKLKYSDIPRASESAINGLAAANDPLDHYMGFLPKTPKWKRKLGKMMMSVSFAENIRQGIAWTIENGYSFVLWIPASSTKPPSTPGDKMIGKIVLKIINEIRLFYTTKEQRKRRAEYKKKLQEAVQKYIGERVSDMLEVASLGTAPERQGRGYASALVTLITNAADEQGRATWLGSSNVAANTAFYNSLGFVTVGTFYLGDENPTWDEPPVPIAIMVREFKEKK